MTRRARLAVSALLAAAALAGTGCSTKHEIVTVAETEGIYVTVDGLKYQIQVSRILNPASPEDQAYLRGLPESEAEPAQDEVWFGVFMRVENDGEEPRPTAEDFRITDTQGDEFEPIELDPEFNVFMYEPDDELAPGKLMPEPNSPAFDNTIRGELLLFKLNNSALYNRPMEFEIESPTGGDGARIDIDV